MSNISISQINAIKDHIVVQDMNFSSRTLNSGLILLGDDRTTTGIRPRWAKVCAIGPEQKNITVGQWVLVEHGRWTRGVEVFDESEKVTVRRIDPDSVLLVSDEQPADESISTAVYAEAKSR